MLTENEEYGARITIWDTYLIKSRLGNSDNGQKFQLICIFIHDNAH